MPRDMIYRTVCCAQKPFMFSTPGLNFIIQTMCFQVRILLLKQFFYFRHARDPTKINNQIDNQINYRLFWNEIRTVPFENNHFKVLGNPLVDKNMILFTQLSPHKGANVFTRNDPPQMLCKLTKRRCCALPGLVPGPWRRRVIGPGQDQKRDTHIYIYISKCDTGATRINIFWFDYRRPRSGGRGNFV